MRSGISTIFFILPKFFRMRLFAKGLSDMASPKFSGGWLNFLIERIRWCCNEGPYPKTGILGCY
jgi:hypothetical protein